jgi:hypothetical protein
MSYKALYKSLFLILKYRQKEFNLLVYQRYKDGRFERLHEATDST